MSERIGYCVFVTSICEGVTPLVYDEKGDPVIFATCREAELDMLDSMLIRIGEYLDGKREFEDATSVEEYVCKVVVEADGCLRVAVDD